MVNTEIAQRAYAAFGSGDMPALLAMCAPDIKWEYFGQVPWAEKYNGHDEVLRFFTILGSTLDFETFEPREFIEAKDAVTVIGGEKCTIRATGARYDNNHWVHIFYVQDGKISRYVGFDTEAIAH
jgi:ketosteroid isomerase-like protein